MPLDLVSNPYKSDFPLLAHNEQLSYLDSAATAQRPQCVLDAQTEFYTTMNANPLRGLYSLSSAATLACEDTRKIVAEFLGANNPREVVFTKNASESLNLIATSLGEAVLQPGDEVVLSIMEHHSNILPWQKICKAKGAQLVWLYPDETGRIPQSEIDTKIGPHTKIVSIAHVSNVLGAINPVCAIADAAHAYGAYVVVDAAQSVPHIPVNVNELDCDLLAFSGHKVLSPMGVGVVWGRLEILDLMPPFLVGGEMIESVSIHDATYAEVPYKFEAGTQDAAGIYTLGVALGYLKETLDETAQRREEALMAYAMERLNSLDFIELIGSSKPSDHIGVISFNVQGIHPHDVAGLLDMKAVCIRAGRHCAEPLLTWMGIDSCCRASIAFYNDKKDIDQLIDGLEYVWSVFHG